MRASLPLAHALLAAGQQSLVENFEVTVPATNALVSLAHEALGDRVAARQTGGGFGGAVVCLSHASDVHTLLSVISLAYTQQTGLHADIIHCHPSAGLEVTWYD